ncbi:MAG: hypothetical protein U9N11_07890 [Campylobacterota bacterium]|nr:hypothetical protein [Campylobacterota bacterium]
MTNILKFFFGIVLAQVATYLLVILSPNDLLTPSGMLRFVVPLVFIALALAFWFASIAAHHSRNSFVKERESLRKETQRDKERIIKEAQRNITVESTKTHAKANFKVGAAFAGALGVGALFVFAQMVTAGLLALAATGGAMGGYYIRSKKAKRERLISIDAPQDVEVIEHKS